MKTRIIQDDPGEPKGQESTVGAPDEATRARNLAGRMGAWSAQHRKTAIVGWFVFVILAFAAGNQVGPTMIDEDTAGVGESGRAARILDAGFQLPAGESVLIQSENARATDPAFRAVVEGVVADVSSLEAVQDVRSPFEEGNEGQIAENGRSVLIAFQIRGPADDAADKIDPVVVVVKDAQEANPDLFIGSFGVSGDEEIDGAFMDDLKKAGLLSLPVTLIILLIVFGSVVAASIPLLLALTAIIATFGLVALPSSIVPLDETVYEVILLIGLAVGVDYSMFYLKREREERAAGRSEEAALAAAAATSGRSVLISGLTVIVAMAGMFLAGIQGMSAFAVGTVIVVAVAMLGSLTVLPAVLCWLGDRVERGRVPFVGRFGRYKTGGGLWCWIVTRVLRRPWLSAALSGGILIALAVPALQLHPVQAGVEAFPQSLPSIQTYNRIQSAFPGSEIPAEVVIKAPDIAAPEVQSAIASMEERALATGRMHEPITIDVNDAGTVANVSIPVAGTGTDDASEAALAALRNDVIPATVGPLPEVEVAVTGLTAQSKDFTDKLKSVSPFVFGFVLLLAFVLMLVAFRSLVIAATAIALNLLSIGAAYGVMVLVFQHGIGKGILGFESTAGIDSFLPIFMFVILFGLSMDYHVFILSRIREAYDHGRTTEDAVAYGISSSAGVVTSAAIVMVCVFSVFATLSMLIFKQFGVGLAAAILIDATIIRAVLLPATMKLLGERNWYLPNWLEWLPHLERADGTEPVKVPPALGPTG